MPNPAEELLAPLLGPGIGLVGVEYVTERTVVANQVARADWPDECVRAGGETCNLYVQRGDAIIIVDDADGNQYEIFALGGVPGESREVVQLLQPTTGTPALLSEPYDVSAGGGFLSKTIYPGEVISLRAPFSWWPLAAAGAMAALSAVFAPATAD